MLIKLLTFLYPRALYLDNWKTLLSPSESAFVKSDFMELIMPLQTRLLLMRVAAQAYDRGSLALAPGLTELQAAECFQPWLFTSALAESDARYGGQVWCRALIQPRPTSATRAAEAGGWSAVSTTMRCGGSNGKWM